MRITGTTYFAMDSIINGRRASDMTEKERAEFAERWKAKHGGEVRFIDYKKKQTK